LNVEGRRSAETPLTRHTGIELPLIGGAMYPCSNVELVAAVSAAGGIGVLQPLTLVYVFGLDLRDGIRRIRALTDRPIGMNVLTEKSSKTYIERMSTRLDIAVDEGVRFFVSSLGNPRWIVDRVSPVGGVVYHDVTERKWALKARDAGVQGLVAVNRSAGGHAGDRTAAALLDEVADIGLPVVCAGGVAQADDLVRALRMGYAGVQIGTRFIATDECSSPVEYKQAIVDASADDIVLTRRITGVPVAVIRTERVEREGTDVGAVGRWLLAHNRFKHWARAWLSLRSLIQLKRGATGGMSHKDYWQAGKSVAGVHAIEPVGVIVDRFRKAIEKGVKGKG
jgi:nitronate monooxygenase